MAKSFSDPQRDDRLISQVDGQPNVVVDSIETPIGLPHLSSKAMDSLIADFERIASGAHMRGGHLRGGRP